MSLAFFWSLILKTTGLENRFSTLNVLMRMYLPILIFEFYLLLNCVDPLKKKACKKKHSLL